MTNPILLHVHVPKTAGTTMNDLLFRNYGRRYSQLGIHWQRQLLTDSQLDAILRLMPKCVALTSHKFSFPTRRELSRPYLAFGFVRDPVRRIISEYRFHCVRAKQGLVAKPTLDAAGFGRYLENADRITPIRTEGVFNTVRNPQSVYLRAAQAKCEGMASVLERENLFIGLTSRFDESLLVLASKISKAGLAFDSRYLKSNVTSEDCIGVEDAGDLLRKYGDQLTEWNADDLDLVRHAEIRLDMEIANWPGDFASDLARFRSDLARYDRSPWSRVNRWSCQIYSACRRRIHSSEARCERAVNSAK